MGVTAGRGEDIAGAAPRRLQLLCQAEASQQPAESRQGGSAHTAAEPRGSRARVGVTTAGRRAISRANVMIDRSLGCRWPALGAAALALAQFVLGFPIKRFPNQKNSPHPEQPALSRSASPSHNARDLGDVLLEMTNSKRHSQDSVRLRMGVQAF